MIFFSYVSFSIVSLQETKTVGKGEEETTGEATEPGGTESETKGSDGTAEDIGKPTNGNTGGAKEDAGCIKVDTGGTLAGTEVAVQDPEGAKQDAKDQSKNEADAEGCCCILI